jgi:hypothetical protein
LKTPDSLGRQILALELVPPPRSLIILAVDHVRVDFRCHPNRRVPEAGGDYPKLSAPPRDVLDEFRRQHGFRPDHSDFMEWYRAHFPKDYALLFR